MTGHRIVDDYPFKPPEREGWRTVCKCGHTIVRTGITFQVACMEAHEAHTDHVAGLNDEEYER